MSNHETSREGRTNQAINNVFSVRIVPTVGPLTANKVHNLMLSLARDTGIGNINLHLPRRSAWCDSKTGTVAHILPTGICVKLLNYPVSQ